MDRDDELRLLCVLAHPDDEALGNAGMLARYAAEGIETHVVTATRGERGWQKAEEENPGLDALGRIREAELRAACELLGVRSIHFLDYIDGDLDQADPAEAIAKIVGHVRRVRPQVVVTFGPDGAYGHPDHVAISQFTTAALVCAADPLYSHPHAGTDAPHRVSKLYYMVLSKTALVLLESHIGEMAMPVDGIKRRTDGWDDWAITAKVEARAYWRQAWEAILCHQSQLPSFNTLQYLSDRDHESLWGAQTYYRVYSLVNGGRARESDLFEGLR